MCERDVYEEPHSELHRTGLVAKLNKTMYETQDGSNAWQKLWGEHLRSSRFELAGHMMQLKRVARYLKGVPRKAQQYPAQEPSRAHLEVHVDSYWAGDTVTRRSTSGVIARRGRHLLRHSSTVQKRDWSQKRRK